MRKLILTAVLSVLAFGPSLNLYAQNHTIVVTWTASPDAASYSIYRGPAAGQESGTPIATGVTATTYTDSNVSAGQTWVYGVVAVSSAGGKSAMAESQGCTVPVAAPSGVSCKAN